MLTYPSPGVPALASSSQEPNCRKVTIEAEGSAPPSAIGVGMLDEATLVAGDAGDELDVGALVVGVLGAGTVGFGALGRPLPLPCALAFMAGATTRATAKAAVRGNERFVTMPLDELAQRSKSPGKLTLGSLTFDF